MKLQEYGVSTSTKQECQHSLALLFIQHTSALMTVTSPILYGALLLLRCSCSMSDCSLRAQVSRTD
jgi:hypothetical protein